MESKITSSENLFLMTTQNYTPPIPLFPGLPGVNTPPHASPEPLRPYTLSPPLLFIIGALASIFLVIGYYQILLKYCSSLEHFVTRRTHRRSNTIRAPHEDQQVSNTSLDPSIIARIPVRPYNSKDADLSTECSVCLAEFRDGEAVRVLPRCGHAFHIPCIGIWLHGQSSCPVCRADVAMAFSDLIHSPSKHEQRLWPSPAIESRERSGSNRLNGNGEGNGETEFGSSQWYRRFVWSRRVNSQSRIRLYTGESSDINSVNGPPSQETVIDLGDPSHR